MKNVSILDCTLRDGGRIIDCKFNDSVIKDMSKSLSVAGIEIVELGFLRDKKLVTYKGDSTFFTNIEQMNCFIDDSMTEKSIYTAFIDYNMFDFNDLPVYDGCGVQGIRVGFTKKQYEEERNSIIEKLNDVKLKGYKLFVQAVNILAYSDKEILEIIDIINEIKPYSFGIVDTYGAMYLEDMTHIFDLVDYNLDKSICIDIHSHNNMQSSFAFSQEIARIAPEDRNIILDATLNGMGKCAGNLNTELIVDYLNRKKNFNYDLDLILDIIDLYLTPLKEKYVWGYSIPAFMAGIYKSHPNNIIYLTEKYRLKSKDIKYIISGISEEKRQRYDYENIGNIYREYFSTVYDDKECICNLKKVFNEKSVVVLAPGKTVIEYEKKIKSVIDENNAVVISINFISQHIPQNYLFCANAIHWRKLQNNKNNIKYIVTSNITENIEDAYKVNYTSLIEEDRKLPDNSTIMLLNLLQKIGVRNVFIAGFDGIKENGENYVNETFVNSGHGLSISESNKVIAKLYRDVKERFINDMKIELITPSIYSNDI